MDINIQEKINEFEGWFERFQRKGKDELLEFIRKSDFYTAPASTRYHGNFEGGLLIHSLNVLNCLCDKLENPMWKAELADISTSSLIIVALLHDICKTYFYKIDYRNAKVDNVWTKVPYYTIDNKFPYGHGEKSVMMIEQFMQLEPIERYAIRWHMGYTEPKEYWNDFSAAIEKYPLVLALHEADTEASHILEGNNGE